MPESGISFSSLYTYFPQAKTALQKDRWAILGFGVLLGLAGLALGLMFLGSAKSSALVVVAPMPVLSEDEKKAIEGEKVSNPIERGATFNPMELAPKMDVTSIGLLCKSDEVMQRTMDALNASQKLHRPVRNLRVLRDSLYQTITVAKETPMDKLYSDIIELGAKTKDPEDAALIVNAWAQEVIAAVDRYEDNIEKPMLRAYQEQYDTARRVLTEVEEEREAWRALHDMKMLETRKSNVNAVIIKQVGDLNDIGAKQAYEDAVAKGYEEHLTLLDPKENLNWTFPAAVLSGLFSSGPGARAADKAVSAPTEKGKEESVGTVASNERVLTREEINNAYWSTYVNLITSKATAAGYAAQKQEIGTLLDKNKADFDQLNAEYALLDKEQERLERRYLLAKMVHDVLFPRREWADIATRVDYSMLQVLSKGSVWPVSRMAAVVLALFLAGLGFLTALCASLLMRLYVQPRLKSMP